MKKIFLAFLVVSFLALPFVSNNVLAGATLCGDYDTGIKAEAPEDTVVLSWEICTCEPWMNAAIVDITYKFTSPKKVNGGFDLPPTIDRTMIGGIWYGSATFGSWIDSDHGTNHGEITITFPKGIVISWSFNVRHS